MLKIFKDHDARTCILDDFCFYDDREKALRERKARHQAFVTTDAADIITDEMSSTLSGARNLNEGRDKIVATGIGVSLRKDGSASSDHDSPLNQLSSSLSQRLVLEDDDKRVAASDLGSGGEVHCESVDKETSV